MATDATRAMFGRRKVVTEFDRITAENITSVLDEVLPIHDINSFEIDYLYKYYRGKQPVLNRTKEYNDYINNKIVVNRANEIVTFKSSYLMGEPVQYVNRSEEAENTIFLNELNDYMFVEDKSAKDKQLAEWFYISGIAYRMIFPDENYKANSLHNESPFNIFTLDPRNTFVIHKNDLTNKPLAGVTYTVHKDGTREFSIYTDTEYYRVYDRKIIEKRKHYCGGIPIIEYKANNAMLGAFEVCLPLLDSINNLQSNRLDSIEQYVQALMVLKGVDISAEDFQALKELGGIKVPENGDVKYLIQELNQTQTQTLMDDMYDTVLTICGMPNRNGGTSTSDTGTAVIYRDGWSSAESRAKESEQMFKASEKEFLKIALSIVNAMTDHKAIKLSSVDIRFTRRFYENNLQKSQILISMLNNEKIHPSLAFQYCGMFVDPELAYTKSLEYYEENKSEPIEESTENAEENAEIFNEAVSQADK